MSEIAFGCLFSFLKLVFQADGSLYKLLQSCANRYCRRPDGPELSLSNKPLQVKVMVIDKSYLWVMYMPGYAFCPVCSTRINNRALGYGYG